jgi:hypothetical protein
MSKASDYAMAMKTARSKGVASARWKNVTDGYPLTTSLTEDGELYMQIDGVCRMNAKEVRRLIVWLREVFEEDELAGGA